MKNDYVFAKRSHQIHVGWMILAIIICLLIVGNMEKKDAELKQQIKIQKAEYAQLQKTNIQVWTMDSSCADQLKNSTDGILRIKITK